MQTLIEGFEIFPGAHCGSVAMRGLLNHYCNLQLPEAAVFGLGSGLDCGYLSGESLDPAILLFGRTASLEVDVTSALGVDYREQAEADNEKAWNDVREEVLAGRPTMLSGDILYLDYREFKVHFPGHRFVMLGFDDEIEKAFIADRIRPEIEACSYGALAKSRNPEEGMSTLNLWGKFHSTRPERSVEEATRFAIERCARHMLDSVPSDFPGMDESVELTAGVAGIRRLAEELPAWAEREDRRWVAGYAARCIEKFGNGGGYFRRLYAEFLVWARELDPSLVADEAPELAAACADGWTELSSTLFAASDENPDPQVWSKGAKQAATIAEQEQRLFEMLA